MKNNCTDEVTENVWEIYAMLCTVEWGWQLLVMTTYTEFHEHPTDGLVTDPRSQMGSADKRFFFTS
jgi:hypothetical protein